jgi:hypothetical protein
MVSPPQLEFEKSVCGVIKTDGKPCQSKVKPGCGPCMWHAKTPSQKIRSWAKNRTLGFVLTVVFGAIGVIGVLGWGYDEFFEHPPVQKHKPERPVTTGPATTTGPNSPATTGDNNRIEINNGTPPPDSKIKDKDAPKTNDKDKP